MEASETKARTTVGMTGLPTYAVHYTTYTTYTTLHYNTLLHATLHYLPTYSTVERTAEEGWPGLATNYAHVFRQTALHHAPCLGQIRASPPRGWNEEPPRGRRRETVLFFHVEWQAGQLQSAVLRQMGLSRQRPCFMSVQAILPPCLPAWPGLAWQCGSMTYLNAYDVCVWSTDSSL
ncbi:hypothetical protein LX32DRAFT_287500 [Colletotrichum zoysiae]|uniref:Uncharacterized protein n=1 Tax=Colletotrichum zoysiae TaxID=1216348 RepID=A0AAD9HN75_9PEZI|nr:hypothetical protein LX32DRAFT_287500 [Colletotrichum zoysiae]